MRIRCCSSFIESYHDGECVSTAAISWDAARYNAKMTTSNYHFRGMSLIQDSDIAMDTLAMAVLILPGMLPASELFELAQYDSFFCHDVGRGSRSYVRYS